MSCLKVSIFLLVALLLASSDAQWWRGSKVQDAQPGGLPNKPSTTQADQRPTNEASSDEAHPELVLGPPNPSNGPTTPPALQPLDLGRPLRQPGLLRISQFPRPALSVPSQQPAWNPAPTHDSQQPGSTRLGAAAPILFGPTPVRDPEHDSQKAGIVSSSLLPSKRLLPASQAPALGPPQLQQPSNIRPQALSQPQRQPQIQSQQQLWIQRQHPSKDPLNGQWSSWVTVTPCSVSCGIGVVTASRQCNSLPPQNGGALCVGASQWILGCSRQCPGEWSQDTPLIPPDKSWVVLSPGPQPQQAPPALPAMRSQSPVQPPLSRQASIFQPSTMSPEFMPRQQPSEGPGAHPTDPDFSQAQRTVREFSPGEGNGESHMDFLSVSPAVFNGGPAPGAPGSGPFAPGSVQAPSFQRQTSSWPWFSPFGVVNYGHLTAGASDAGPAPSLGSGSLRPDISAASGPDPAPSSLQTGFNGFSSVQPTVLGLRNLFPVIEQMQGALVSHVGQMMSTIPRMVTTAFPQSPSMPFSSPALSTASPFFLARPSPSRQWMPAHQFWPVDNSPPPVRSTPMFSSSFPFLSQSTPTQDVATSSLSETRRSFPHYYTPASFSTPVHQQPFGHDSLLSGPLIPTIQRMIPT